MNVLVDLDELLDAHEWVSADGAVLLDAKAFIHRSIGTIHWVCPEIGEDGEPPEDIDDGTLYIAVPTRYELNLGRPVALRFAQEHLPRSVDAVYDYFRRSGAYSRFKALLERTGQLEAWYQYEKLAKEEALSEWCDENGFATFRKNKKPGASAQR
jgi:hypothetical protein